MTRRRTLTRDLTLCGGLALWRILRCNPWGGSGYDPVPGCGHDHCGHDHTHDDEAGDGKG